MIEWLEEERPICSECISFLKGWCYNEQTGTHPVRPTTMCCLFEHRTTHKCFLDYDVAYWNERDPIISNVLKEYYKMIEEETNG